MTDVLPGEGTDWFDSWRGVLFASHKVMRRAAPDLMARTGLSVVFMDVLGRLSDAGPERRMRMQDLQEESLFTRSGMTRVIDRMEAEGLVTRETVPGDRRGVYVAITEKGMQRFLEAMTAHSDFLEREFGERLTPAQHRAVGEALYGFWHDEPATT